jgi:pimeloyl-ACP methyl ester carboxylesterase
MTDAPQTKLAHLAVPGATLYYKMQGHGPLLLMLQGGDGDADGTDALTSHVIDHYTVLSYDRRGLSRSPVDDPSAPVDLSTHCDDAARLLAAVTDEPALVFGTSIGALLGLDLVSRHPESVGLLVSHEPPATELLAEPGRRQAVREQEEVEEAYLNDGVAEAMRKFVALAGIRFDDREPDVALPVPKPERIANLEFFLAHDAPAVRLYRLDLPSLRATAHRVVPAAGESTETFPRHCAEVLARELGRPLAEFPGGHTGSLLRPRAFAARLRQVLSEYVSSVDNGGDSPADRAKGIEP